MATKVAVATDAKMVAQHFGRCAEFTIAEVEDGKVLSCIVLPNPGHQPGVLPKWLLSMQVQCVITGGMGPRAHALLEQYGIESIVGVSGEVQTVLEAYAAGELQAGDNLCETPADAERCIHASSLQRNR